MFVSLRESKPLFYKMSGTIKYPKSLPNLPKVLFWDIQRQAPDYENHPEWVIQRVLERGSMDDIAEVILFYGKEKVKEVLTTTLHLDEDILYLASAILDIPLKNFLCYSTRQYRKIF
jgi:hypothetical protein